MKKTWPLRFALLPLLLFSCGEGASSSEASSEDLLIDEAGLVYSYRPAYKGYYIEDYRGDASSIEIPDRFSTADVDAPVVGINDFAFSFRKNLQTVSLGDHVSHIGHKAFAGSSVENLYVTPALRTLERDAFSESDVKTNASQSVIYLPTKEAKYGVAIGNEITSNTEDTSLYIEDGCETIIPGALMDGDGKAFAGVVHYPSSIEAVGNNNIADTGIASFEGKDGTLNCRLCGSNAFRQSDIRTLTFAEECTEIGPFAFDNCDTLTSASVPTTVKTIWPGAFAGESNLSELTLPFLETSGGADGFFGRFFGSEDPEDADAFPFGASIALKVTLLETAKTIPEGAFVNCRALSSITLPSGITSIGDRAFYFCRDLASINLPDTITSIGKEAFQYCESLTGVTLPSGLQSIGEAAFDGCSSLSSLSFPSSLTSVGERAFSGCSNLVFLNGIENLGVLGRGFFSSDRSLAEFVFPEGTEEIPADFFYGCTALKKVTIPSSVKKIGLHAFKECTSLTDILLPEGLKTIEYEAFLGCSSLKSLVIPSSVTEIGLQAFMDTTLTEITIPTSVFGSEYDPKEGGIGTFFNGFVDLENRLPSSLKKVTICPTSAFIPSYAFAGASNLEEVVIPDSVTELGVRCFADCFALKKIEIPDSVKTIDMGAFSNCSSLTEIEIPDGAILQNQSLQGCSSLTRVHLPYAGLNNLKSSAAQAGTVSSIKYYFFGDTVPESLKTIEIGPEKDHVAHFGFAGLSTVASITLSPNTKNIGDYAFQGCSSLTALSLPSTVETIGERAFWDCSSLESLAFPSGITTLKSYLFANCTKLAAVYIPASVTSLVSNPFGAPYGTKAPTNIHFYCEAPSKPDTWPSGWNNEREVTWGVARADFPG